MLSDIKGLQMPALTVFSAGIRYLKNHLLDMCRRKDLGIRESEVHWVVTVPAIWDDTAKQFMREAAVQVCELIPVYFSQSVTQAFGLF